MKFNKLFVMALCIICVLSMYASAAVIDAPRINADTSVVTVSGSIPDVDSPGMITYEIIYPEKYTEDFDVTNAEDIKDKLLDFGQAFYNADGTYTFDVQFADKSGDYTICVCAPVCGKDTCTYFYSSKEDKFRFIEDAADAKTASELYGIMDLENEESVFLKSFGIDYSTIDAVGNKTDFSKILHNINSEFKPTKENMKRLTDNIELSLVVASFNEKTVKDASEYFETLLFNEKLIAAYEKLEERKANVDASLMGKSFMTEDGATLSSINDAFFESVILTMVNDRTSWNDIIYIADNFHDELDLDYKDYEKNVKDKGSFAKDFGRNYSTTKDFAKAFNKAIPEGKSSGGGSSGGGGGGFSGTSVVTPQGATSSVPDMDVISGNFFADVPESHWAYASIKELTDKNILNGTGAGNFEPARTITREEFVKVMVASLGLTSEAEVSFADFDASKWYAPYVKKAVAAGLISGYSDGRFGVGDGVRRCDMAVMICRALGLNSAENNIIFADDTNIPDYAKDAVYALKTAGIVSGDTDGNFNPTAYLTRAECAQVISTMMKGAVK